MIVIFLSLSLRDVPPSHSPSPPPPPSTSSILSLLFCALVPVFFSRPFPVARPPTHVYKNACLLGVRTRRFLVENREQRHQQRTDTRRMKHSGIPSCPVSPSSFAEVCLLFSLCPIVFSAAITPTSLLHRYTSAVSLFFPPAFLNARAYLVSPLVASATTAIDRLCRATFQRREEPGLAAAAIAMVTSSYVHTGTRDDTGGPRENDNRNFRRR